MKLADILKTASSNMLRNKIRTLLTVIAIFIGAMTLTLTNGIGSGIATYIDEQLGNLGAEDVLLVQGKGGNPFEGGGPQKYDENVTISAQGGFPVPLLSPKDVQKIADQPGIKSVELDIATSPDYIAGANGDKYKMVASAFVDGMNLTLAAGKLPTNKTAEFQVALPLNYASPLGFASNQAAVGKAVQIGVKDATGVRHEIEAKIVAVQEQTLVSAAGVIINRPLASAMYDVQTKGLPEAAKHLQPMAIARFDKNISEEKLKEIKDGLDRKGYTATTIQDQIGIFKQVISAVIMVLNFFAGIALLAASFGIVNTLLMAVQERTKEIGLMKAMGMRRRKVFLLFSVEAILLGFWGSLLGSLAGIGIGKLGNKIASDTFLKDLAGFDLTSFPLQSVGVIMLIIMGIAFLAGTLPARRAAKQNPIDALRYE
jgi:putative ABC transport system permease protein